jgi:segregation and condensation protein A
MSVTDSGQEDFDAPVVNEIAPEDALMVTLDGFEGPLDLLLALARNQKVDIAKISVLALADQYLAFMEDVQKRNLELAADYLVMAAWLAYLKSKLVLPQPEVAGEPTADEMAAALRWRLQRLQAMRKAGAALFDAARLDRDVFARGNPEPIVIEKVRRPTDTIYDLLSAYARERIKRVSHKAYNLIRAPIYLIEEARDRIGRMLGRMPDWAVLSRLLPLDWITGQRRRTALASHLLACLELARDGRIAIRQLAPFGEIMVRDREPAKETSE